MAEKLSDKLKGLFKRADVYLGKAIEKAPKSSKAIGPSQTQYKMFKAGQKTKSLLSGKLPSAAKFASATKKAGKFGKLRAVGRVASRVALPVAAGFEAANLAYKVATLSPEKKAKIKKLKTELSKKSTKQSHADLMKMSTGGDTMLTGGQKKLDKNKDGKISGEDFKMMKAYKGDMAKGYGAARTQGQGLQDENLIPGKSLDYYKDIM